MDEIEARLQAWRAAHPRATLTEMQTAVETELAAYRTALLTRLVQEATVEQAAETPSCPACDQPLRRNGVKRRRLKDKEGTEVLLEREQWRCQRCGLTLFPPG